MRFNRDLTSCVLQVAPETYDAFPAATQAQAVLYIQDLTHHTVRVRLFDATGNPVDGGFAVTVTC